MKARQATSLQVINESSSDKTIRELQATIKEMDSAAQCGLDQIAAISWLAESDGAMTAR